MNNLENNQPNNLPTSSTTLAIFDRIEKEAISPYSRWRFLLEEWALWVLWGATVIVGALALSITVYITISATYELYEATHTNFFTFFVSMLPYIWVILFILMTYLAVVELKKTKHGYRYNTVQVLGSSIVFSILIASGFHFLGFGYLFDHVLGRQIGMYMSMEKMEFKMWQAPENGRLVGVVIPLSDQNDDTYPDGSMLVNFKDEDGLIWQLNATELSDQDFTLLQSQNTVRMLGIKDSDSSFHACAVFPWMFDKPIGWSQMQHERNNFEQRMHNHMRMPKISNDSDSNLVNINPIDHSSTSTSADNYTGICTHFKMMGLVGG